jgi:hypothetical protein
MHRAIGRQSLACGLLLYAFSVAAAGPREPVAILYRVSGEALRTAPGRSPQALRLFDRLPAGAVVELKPGARLALAFVTGRRYELSGPARVTLGRGDLAARAGGVRALPPVPPLPRLAPVAGDELPGPAMGAIRIRSEEITGLYPSHGARSLASSTVLRFAGVEGTRRYSIAVEDERGEIVFSAETTASELPLPEDALRPETSYHWSVRTLDRPGLTTSGEADFATLDARTAQAREELRRFVASAGDEESLQLLAGVDRGLGLWAEAQAELRSAGPRGLAEHGTGLRRPRR